MNKEFLVEETLVGCGLWKWERVSGAAGVVQRLRSDSSDLHEECI